MSLRFGPFLRGDGRPEGAALLREAERPTIDSLPARHGATSETEAVHHAPQPHSGLRQISSATRSIAPWWMHAGVRCPGDHSFRNTWPRPTESIPFLGGFFDGISLRSRNRLAMFGTSVEMVPNFSQHTLDHWQMA